MYKALVGQKYFDRSPAGARSMNQGLAIVAHRPGLPGLLRRGVHRRHHSGFIFTLPFAIGIVGFVGLIFAGVMPRKTDFGSDQAARWRAFGRYLQNIRQYGNLGRGGQALRPVPALRHRPRRAAGYGTPVRERAARTPLATPAWYIPTAGGYGPYHGGRAASVSAGPGGIGPLGPAPRASAAARHRGA